MVLFINISRASWRMDVIIVIFLLALMVLTYSIYTVRFQRNYLLHRKLQLFLTGLLIFTIILFEIEVRYYGWIDSAKNSKYYVTLVWPILWIHLCFAISTVIMWTITFSHAMYAFRTSISPNQSSLMHKRLGRVAFICLWLTVLLGLAFYFFAFIS